MELNTIMVKIQDDIWTISLNRPNVLNAINARMLEELNFVLDQLEKAPNIRVLVIKSEGDKAFSSGADLKELSLKGEHESEKFIEFGRSTINRIDNLSIPTIAVINGYSIGGGCELALACDIRLASENAQIGLTETKLGSIPSWGGIRRLVLLVGAGRAKELLFTGDLIRAEEALRIGLVNHVFSLDEIVDQTYDLARKMSANSPLSIKLIDDVIKSIYKNQIARSNKAEKNCIKINHGSTDLKEGRIAFGEKRTPKFSGK